MIFTNQENTLATAVKYALKPKGSLFHNQEYWIKKAIHIASKDNIVANKVPIHDIIQCVKDNHVDLAAHLYSKAQVKARVEDLYEKFVQVAKAEYHDNPKAQELYMEALGVTFRTFDALSVTFITKKISENASSERKIKDLVKLLLVNFSSEFKEDNPETMKKLESVEQIIKQGPSVNNSVELFEIFNSIIPAKDFSGLMAKFGIHQPSFGKFNIDMKIEKGKPNIIASLKIDENTDLGKALAELGKKTGGMHIGTDDFRIPSPVNAEVGLAQDGSVYLETGLDVPGSGAISTAVKTIGQEVSHHHDAL